MLTELQKKTCQAIVNIFETGTVQGDYSNVTVLRGDTGHLTYGRSQTTLASGNLFILLKDYCDTPGAEYAQELAGYLEKLSNRDIGLDSDNAFRSLLRDAGSDPVMKLVQDGFFDRIYWQPALKSATNEGIKTPLGVGVVYDSHIHGSWQLILKKTNSKLGTVVSAGEKVWIAGYVDLRKNWLATHSNKILHKTVYRMDTFLNLIAQNQWDLNLPLVIRGIRIDRDSLDPCLRVSAQPKTERILMHQIPAMKGEDVKAVQAFLKAWGETIKVDGIYGPATVKAVEKFQKKSGLKTDGIVGPATRSLMGI